ncbi:hypothetical protein SAMN05216565_103263 [Litchfieldia salsa]|uniref:Uncharacterized protein n=1 Tax=Litchfieldia salsa TaxID=930152 RepID=A0A1H0T2N7_9BACI|nr:hypothetical protein SAMN05216565_103263 [Litchfieldia salsa]
MFDNMQRPEIKETMIELMRTPEMQQVLKEVIKELNGLFI